MLSYFDRRKQRLDKLAATIKGADDQTLASVLASASTKELAAVLGLVPVDRANRLVIDVPKDRLDAALAASLDGATHSERTLAKLAADIGGAASTAATSDAEAATTPMCVKALDLAGRFFGTLTIQSKE